MFDDILRKLEDLKRNLQALEGQHKIPGVELFPDEFMLRNTDFQSLSAMFEASRFRVETEEDFAAIPDDEWDDFIRTRTRFTSWDEMQSAAGSEWITKRLKVELE